MNILVIGCGKVGSRLAGELSRRQHDVSVVDQNEENFDFLDRTFNGFTTHGVPIDQDVLKKAGIENCDALIAVTQDDNVNLMVAQMAKELFQVPQVLVRILDPGRGTVFTHFGLHTICPTELTVSAMCSALSEEHEEQTVSIGSHTFSFETVDVPREYVGKNAKDLSLEEGVVLYAVDRGGAEMLLYGGEDIELQKGDRLIFSRLVG